MVKIVMQDGNTIYASYDSLGLLNAYKSALKDLKGKKVCVFYGCTDRIFNNRELQFF